MVSSLDYEQSSSISIELDSDFQLTARLFAMGLATIVLACPELFELLNLDPLVCSFQCWVDQTLQDQMVRVTRLSSGNFKAPNF